nr:MAG TPA: hypothetical protein [Caudoviricetes sp.]
MAEARIATALALFRVISLASVRVWISLLNAP